MVGTGWRRAFYTIIPKGSNNNNKQTKIAVENQKDENRNSNDSNVSTPKLSDKFGFFSNPSTPRLKLFSPSLQSRTTTTDSPKLHCQITAPNLSQPSSTPTSPKSPSSFTLLRNTFGFRKTRCGICLQSVKAGQGKAIFTAECSHSFHFPCVSEHARDNRSNVCAVCNAHWCQEPLLTCSPGIRTEKEATQNDHHTTSKPSDLKLYNDDEPLMFPTFGDRFNPIPESDENDDGSGSVRIEDSDCRNVDVTLLNDSAVVSASRGSETHAIVLKIRAPARTTSHRAPAVDLVTVIDVIDGMDGDKLGTMRRAMRVVISYLSSRDRLSIVAFSTCSKRLLPFRRMTANGRKSAGKIVEVMRKTSGRGISAGDAVRKAAKVIQDRRERNPVSMIVVLTTSSNGRGCCSFFNLSSTRFPHLNIPVNAFGFNDVSPCDNALADGAFKKCLKRLLSVALQDFRIQLGLYPGSGPAEIVAVYSCTGRPVWVGSGAGQIVIGDLLTDEERELLIEMKVPNSERSRAVMSVQTYYRNPSTSSSDPIRSKEQAVLVPKAVRSDATGESIQRLRSMFVTTRAVAESRRLTEYNDFSGAERLLTSARALVAQSGGSSSNSEFISGLKAELSNVNRRSQREIKRKVRERATEAAAWGEKAEPLTPTSAWRAAENLAKVAMMRKALNRVSDLHGFENARF